jgi:MFS family permease
VSEDRQAKGAAPPAQADAADSSGSSAQRSAAASTSARRGLFGIHPLKIVFAMEYVLQGLANPFQGITYQPFYRHFRFDYGLTEAATQRLFANSYLAWSFKPLIGFVIDAIGKTKLILTMLLAVAILLYLVTPVFDNSASMFYVLMIILSVFLAATDVTVDRATVVAGDEEAKATGRSKAATVGLNQAICWAAIYGTGIVAAVMGGYLAENIQVKTLLYMLSVVPAVLLGAVLLLPKDRKIRMPFLQSLGTSVSDFWRGLFTGPVLWIIAFTFIFHFQPALGALWNHHLIQNLGFTQTHIGFSDGAAYAGLLLGVILFSVVGIRWQEKMGLKTVFRIFIVLSVLMNLTQYLLVDPWFTAITGRLAGVLTFVSEDTVRLVYLSAYNFLMAILIGLIRMSTFSLVGAVIPVAAAGSLFAGFMSINNLAYSFSYSSGAWLYENGLRYDFMRTTQESLFGIPGAEGDSLSISMLILIGSSAYLLSFLAAHMLPDRQQTLATDESDQYMAGPEKYEAIGASYRKLINVLAVSCIVMLSVALSHIWGWQASSMIKAVLIGFFAVAFLRKVTLDAFLRHAPAACPTKL